MPTILLIAGWRIFFYSNEGSELIHIHAEKSDMECKYWLKVEEYEIEEEYSYNLTPAAKREIRKIIFEHFDYIVLEWNSYFKKQ
jgi:Ni,Fe-hydrogenase maturation factor